MLTRRVALLQQCSRLRNIYSRKSTKAKLDPTELAFPEKMKLPIPKPKNPKRDPFVKSFFLGKFDPEMLTYPEPQSDQRFREFNEWLKPIEDYVKTIDAGKVYGSSSFSVEMREKLKELEIYGARIPYEYDGIDLLQSEYFRLIEVLSTVPKLGMNFIQCNNYPVELLKREGTVEQKHEYLRKIATGHYHPVICANESEYRIDPDNFRTVALLSDDEKTWIISGQKTFLQHDNNANLFIVYALGLIGGNRRHTKEVITPFLVDKNTPGVGELIPVKSPWLGGENMFSVKFRDVTIPYENIIGEVGSGQQSLENYFTNDLHFSAGVYISALKNFLNSLINHVIHNNAYERECVQQIIGKTALSIYVMESMAYLTTSLGDLYEGQDLIMEQAIVKDFCSKECITRLIDAFRLLDTHLCSATFPFEQIVRNQMFGLHGNADLRSYIGLLGVQYSGIYFGGYVKKSRNPFDYPSFIFRKLFGLEEIFPKRYLAENLHPSFQNHVPFLEQAFGRLEKSCQTVLVRHGAEILTHEMDLHRLSEMASLIYGVTAAFGRSSRSYCIGLANAEHEMSAAFTFAYEAYVRIDALGKEIEHGDYVNGNTSHKIFSQRMYDLKKYCLEHPLEKNW